MRWEVVMRPSGIYQSASPRLVPRRTEADRPVWAGVLSCLANHHQHVG